MDSESSHTIEVTAEAESWHAAVTDPLGTARRAVEAALAGARAAIGSEPLPPVEVSVLLADDARVRELNRVWRGV
ncbi:MAG TPA: hypothetical protein VF606_03875, partial [Geminicoccaceae bacterium]